MSFDYIIDEVTKKLGVTLREQQTECLRIILEDRCDLMINLPTGYGKSLVYHLLPDAICLKDGVNNACVIVISPLNIVQNDQLQRLKDCSIPACRLDVKCNQIAFESDSSDDESASAVKTDKEYEMDCTTDLKDVVRGKFKIVHCHPEAIFSCAKGRALLEDKEFKKHVVAIVVDECHKVPQWYVHY
jgi:bloom syndrome protein